MGTEICEYCGEEKEKRGIGNHREACRKLHEPKKEALPNQPGIETRKEIQASVNDTHNDSLQNFENVKTEAKPLGEEQGSNVISSPEIHIDSVLPGRQDPAHQEDRKETPGNSVSQANEISDQDPDRKEENEGGIIWGAVAAFFALLFGIILTLYLWWQNRKKDEAI